MWPMGLLLAVVGSFVGFVFAAPGAVYFNPVVRGRFAFTVHRFTDKDVAIVSLAGPAVNIVLGVLFFAASFFALPDIFKFAAYISFFMAFFNLIPFPPLDGSKVIKWSLPIWAVSIAVAAVGYLLL
jgi:Zn-dependent protease